MYNFTKICVSDLISVMIQEDAETDCSGAISRWLGTSSLTAAAETECGAAVALAGMLTNQKLKKKNFASYVGPTEKDPSKEDEKPDFTRKRRIPKK